MKLVTHTFLTLDGVMQGPGGAEEDPSGGFGGGGWSAPVAGPAPGVLDEGAITRPEALLLSHTTHRPTGAIRGRPTQLASGAAPPRGYHLLESRPTRAGAVYQVLAPKAFEAGGLTVSACTQCRPQRPATTT